MNDIPFMKGPPVGAWPAHVRREPIFEIDPDGTPLVSIAVAGSPRRCTITRDDFDRVSALVGTDQWRLNRSTIQATKLGIGIARLIVGASEVERVTYSDGNKHNLRRANLIVTPLKPWMRARRVVFVDRATLAIPLRVPL